MRCHFARTCPRRIANLRPHHPSPSRRARPPPRADLQRCRQAPVTGSIQPDLAAFSAGRNGCAARRKGSTLGARNVSFASGAADTAGLRCTELTLGIRPIQGMDLLGAAWNTPEHIAARSLCDAPPSMEASEMYCDWLSRSEHGSCCDSSDCMDCGWSWRQHCSMPTRAARCRPACTPQARGSWLTSCHTQLSPCDARDCAGGGTSEHTGAGTASGALWRTAQTALVQIPCCVR